jgi:peptidoglycan/xylan/chitin deacetylase (PgdA/CDA1 family)
VAGSSFPPPDTPGGVVLHPAAAEPGTRLARRLGEFAVPLGAARASPASLPLIVAASSGAVAAVAASGSALPEGAARAEGMGVLARRAAAETAWGAPVSFKNVRELIRFSHDRGQSSVDLIRAQPSLLPDLQIGSWFNLRWHGRVARRVAVATTRAWPVAAGALPGRRLVLIAADAAFWAGVKRAATQREWERLTRSSYTAVYYHRIAGHLKQGQERMDISPAAFTRQMRLLRRLGFTRLTSAQVLAFHEGADVHLPRRGYVLTADDGFRDAVDVFRRYRVRGAQIFVCTGSVGGEAEWAGREPLADWPELAAAAAAGAEIGSHSASHVDLTMLERAQLAQDLAEARRRLESALPEPVPILAYPHGRRNELVRRAAAEAGYRAAYTTEPGRNGAGTPPFDLRRIGPKEWDTTLSFLWKATTGELVPDWWERWLLVRAHLRSRLRLRRAGDERMLR